MTDPICILLVEDEPGLAAMVSRELSAAGYVVEVAADGLAALHSLQAAPPDLLILDWMLPGLDGLEILRRVRPALEAPVLMLTARDDEADRVIGLELGADDYLTKPFSLRELLARVRALLRRAERLRAQLAADRAASPGELAFAGLVLAAEDYIAVLDGRLLDLTPTEFDLLRLFLRNPGRTFSRAYLLETVWEQPYIEGDRSVDNAVLRLRRKLGPWADRIETVWGIGYRLRREDPR